MNRNDQLHVHCTTANYLLLLGDAVYVCTFISTGVFPDVRKQWSDTAHVYVPFEW